MGVKSHKTANRKARTKMLRKETAIYALGHMHESIVVKNGVSMDNREKSVMIKKIVKQAFKGIYANRAVRYRVLTKSSHNITSMEELIELQSKISDTIKDIYTSEIKELNSFSMYITNNYISK